MEEKKSCCCKSFPKGLWWLLTLLGLPLLYFLMFNANKDPIETDLSQRVMATLAEEKMDWVNVDIDERGRDVLLTGDAFDDAAKDKAISLAQSVKGVRVVEGNFSEFVPSEDMTFDIKLIDGKLTLDGSVSSQADIDTIHEAAIAHIGKGKVVNNLVIKKEVKSSQILSNASGFTSLVSLITEGGSLSVSPKGIKLAGTVDSKNNKKELMSKMVNTLNSYTFDIPAINGLTVIALEPTEAMSLNAEFKDGKILLNGKVATQGEIDAIVKAATDRVGTDNVVNKLILNETVKPSDWLDKIATLMSLVTEKGSLVASADGVKFTGTLDSKDKESSLINKAKGLLGSFNIPVINGLTVVEPESKPEPVVEATKPEPKPEPVAETKPEIKAINVCQKKLDKAMSGKSIHFATNKAIIKEDSYPLLEKIVAVMSECQNEMSGGISINGHTDSRGDDNYNMALSLRRARAVKTYLKKHQVKSSLLKSIGHGESNPIASNDTREGRAQNRRITFIINK